MIQKLLLIALAGGAGALARYGLGGLVQRWTGGGFPWGTVAVNVVGCFLFGLVVTAASERFGLSVEMRIIILTGFMGAFTTFSTFAYESQQLMADGQWLWAFGNIALQLVVGVAMMIAGIAVGRAV